MARSMLHSPFAQQHPASSSSRVSPFQQSATAGSMHGLDLDDIEASWTGSEYGRRQHFLDVFEPMGTAARSSSVQHRDQDQQRHARLASSHVGIVVADDVLHSSSTGSSSFASSPQPHIIRARAILTTSVSAREHMPSTHPVGLPRLHTTASLGRVDSPRGHGSSGSSTASTRRLQRRSSSLLAATSATASNLWSSLSALGDALGDRSRALLCRSSPVLDNDAGSGRRSNSMDSGSRRSSSVDGGARRSSPGLEGSGTAVTVGAVFLPGSVVGSGASRSPRLTGRLLLRSTTIRRSSARSPAVLIDMNATDSYDDLLALDQFNVKRAVKPSVLKALPVRMPDTRDQQQQRQCHICFESWQPVFVNDSDTAPAGAWDTAAAVGTDQCQRGCGQQHHQQQQQVSQLFDNPQQHAHGLSMMCWTTVVPAPSSPQLRPDDTSLGAATGDLRPSSGGSSGGGSNGSGSSGGSAWQPVVRGWTQVISGHVLHHQGGGPSWAEPASAGASSPQHPLSHGRTVSRGDGWWGVDSSSSSSSQVASQMCGCAKAGEKAGRCSHRAESIQIQQLPCGHEFCSGCIQTWLKDHTSCPVCRWTFPDADTCLINK